MVITKRDGIQVEHPAGTGELAERLLHNAIIARRTFAPLFPTVPDLQINIQWFPQAVWQERGRGPWGMPTAFGNSAVLLPATDVELPEACVVIIDPLTRLEVLTREEVRELKERAPTTHARVGTRAPTRTRRELQEWLKSREFYHELMVDFVLPHEIFHLYCNNVDLKRSPVWPYESLAQWSAEYSLRRSGQTDLARFYYLCYRMYYLAGQGTEGNEGLVKFRNYAWFHGACLVMMGALRERLGEEFIPQVVRRAQGRKLEKDGDWVKVFEEAAVEELGEWFVSEWGVR
jgi:hypothetical protein